MSTNHRSSPYVETETLPDYSINTSYQAQPNAYSRRVKFLVLHYTAESFGQSLLDLTGRNPDHVVSVHYLVADKADMTTDAIIAGTAEDFIYQLVDEESRAWHAGLGSWQGVNDINSTSIGIEIVNLDGNKYPYPDDQINAVVELSKAIVEKYDIAPENVIGHSDLAPDRKQDPGMLFPWEKLYQNGVGAWPDADDVARYMHTKIPRLAIVQRQFVDYGYGMEITGPEVGETPLIVAAFQRHFRPSEVDGKIDRETYAILRALLKKYRDMP